MTIKIQLLPSFIRYAIIDNDLEEIKKVKNILSDLFNIYISLENHDNSLISYNTREYQKSFELMIFKLKNAGLKFEKIEEITLNDNQIIDFINIPEKDNFSIEPNNLEQKKTANNDAQEKKIIT